MNKKWSNWRKNNYIYFNANFPRGKDVVDLGAGEVPFWDLFSQSKTYIGVDWKQTAHVSVLADLSKPIPLQSASCDVVVLSNTLEHVLDPRGLLSEGFRLIRQGGLLIGTVPFIRDVHQAPHDFYRYTPYALRDLLEKNGFINIEITPIGTIYDVFFQTQNSFFNYFLTASNQSLMVRICRKVFSIINKIFQSLFLKAPVSENFAEGYGFKAIKP